MVQDLEIISKKVIYSSSICFPSPETFSSLFTMADKCGNCDCSDSSSCTKKGNSYGAVVMETGKSHFDAIAMDVPAAEHNGKCNCGPSCACVDCNCSH